MDCGAYIWVGVERVVFSQRSLPRPAGDGTMPRMAAQTTWFTFVSPDIWLGEFRLPPDHPGWHLPNAISVRAPLIAFPRTTVRIDQEGKPSIVADPTRAVLYAAGQRYRRGLVSGEGDRCSFITFSHALAAQAALPFDTRADDPATYRFPFVAAAVDAPDYQRHQRTRQRVADPTRAADEDAIREELYWLLGRVVANGYSQHAGHALRRSAAAGQDAVDAVRVAIGRDLSITHSLDELGERACLSPFHLARVFRSLTATSIHAYRTQVRLRASIARIADGEALANVAAEVGFSSQEHLTDRFHRAFGMAPNAWRREMSRIVKARGEFARLA
ncbi:MAG: AraC family transcriptional regulator [Candidatus Limnocylindrales bacterium]